VVNDMMPHCDWPEDSMTRFGVARSQLVHFVSRAVG
jgi:hypothetical protein